MTKLYKIEGSNLREVAGSRLQQEKDIENWIANDISLLGLDAMVIGQQVQTDYGTAIDLLAIDGSGGLVVVELKRDKTPREVVAQVLDYASWVCKLTTPKIYELAENGDFLDNPLPVAFQERFGRRISERLNGSHSMLVIGSEVDSASRRIIEYLANECEVAINTFSFNIYKDGEQQWMTTDLLLDQTEAEVRSERKVQPPWSGYWYVNGGHGDRRSWNDMRKYGFVSAGGEPQFSRPLEKLKPKDRIFVYQKKLGYVGYGIVTQAKTLAKEFVTAEGTLFEQDLENDGIKAKADDPQLAEYVVAVDWQKTFALEEAKTFDGIFSNQNIVCRLRDQQTMDYLLTQFEVNAED